MKLRHTVPPQHEIETRAGSHLPTPSQVREFEKIAPLKKGAYSHDEDKIIVKNWAAFCEVCVRYIFQYISLKMKFNFLFVYLYLKMCVKLAHKLFYTNIPKQLHNWNVKRPFLELRSNNKLLNIRSHKERRKFVQFLADGLPNRSLYSVYHRYKTLYGPTLHSR